MLKLKNPFLALVLIKIKITYQAEKKMQKNKKKWLEFYLSLFSS